MTSVSTSHALMFNSSLSSLDSLDAILVLHKLRLYLNFFIHLSLSQTHQLSSLTSNWTSSSGIFSTLSQSLRSIHLNYPSLNLYIENITKSPTCHSFQPNSRFHLLIPLFLLVPFCIFLLFFPFNLWIFLLSLPLYFSLLFFLHTVVIGILFSVH